MRTYLPCYRPQSRTSIVLKRVLAVRPFFRLHHAQVEGRSVVLFSSASCLTLHLPYFPPFTPCNRWEKIERDVNLLFRRRNIDPSPVKELISGSDAMKDLPTCFQDEMSEIAAKEKARKEEAAILRLKREDEKQKEAAKLASMSPMKRALLSPRRALKKRRKRKGHKKKVELEDDLAADTDCDTASEGEVDEDHVALLSKFEIFSYMRSLHHTASSVVVDHHEQSISEIERVVKLLCDLYANHPCTSVTELSQQCRRRKCNSDEALAYAEIDILSFVRLLKKCQRIHGHLLSSGRFWDLGAGKAQAILAAAQLHDFDSVTGVEVVEDVCALGKDIVKTYSESILPTQSQSKRSMKVEMIMADAKLIKWEKEATVILAFANFSSSTMDELRERADGLPVGSLCISIGQPIVVEKMWGLLAIEKVETTYGTATAYVSDPAQTSNPPLEREGPDLSRMFPFPVAQVHEKVA